MPFLIGRLAISTAALTLAFVAACSSGTSGSNDVDSGTSGSSGTAIAQAIVQAKLAKGASGTCAADGQTIAIGTFSPIAPVRDGAADVGGGKVELSCKVAPAGSGFTVNVSFDVTNGGAGGVAKGFAMSGARTAAGTVDGSSGLVSFISPAGGSFASTTCTFDPTTVTGGSGIGGIAAGRYWTTFHCTDTRSNGSSDLCVIDGEIRVENCIQQ